MHWSWRPKNASSAPLTTRPSVGAARTGSRSAVVKTFSGLRVHFAGAKLRSQSLLCPKPLSCIVHHGKIACATAALCQKQTSAAQQNALFDHLVGAGEKRRRNFQSERPRCADVDHQLELR